MVLFVSRIRLEDSSLDPQTLYLKFPQLKDGAAQLLSVPTKLISPIGALFVNQREFAVTVPHDKHIGILGTDDLTTCVAAVVRHSSSGAIALAHFDGSGVDEAVICIVQRIEELSMGYERKLELSLVGGFIDDKGFSEELITSLLHSFHKQPLEIDLALICVGEQNTTLRGECRCPILYGIGANVKTGEIFPSNFPDRGPDMALRNARHYTGSHQMLDIYDCNLGLLRIGPFNYDPLRGVDLWLQESDDFILQHLSTSPAVEPPHFVSAVRAALKHIRDHPFPAVTVFPDNRPRYYRRDENGYWCPVRY